METPPFSMAAASRWAVTGAFPRRQAVAGLHQKCYKLTLEMLVNYFKMQGEFGIAISP